MEKNSRSVNDLSKIFDLVEDALPTGEEQEYKTYGKTEIVTTMAFLLGLREDLYTQWFSWQNSDIASKLSKDSEANIVRDLCTLRNQLLNNYAQTESEIVYQLRNIDSQNWYDQDAIKRLRKAGVEPVQASTRADGYSEFFSKAIAEHIQKCKQLFPDWIKFEYITDLFYAQNYLKKGVLKTEFTKYHSNRELYPYHLYIHWNPADVGNLLINDGKFLKVVYGQHGEAFTDSSKYRDASSSTKQSIYDVIDHAEKAILTVDCENSDVFKLYGVLKNLNQDEVEKIEKIILYDDYHTTSAWTFLKHFVSIPIEYEEVERVTDRKSLVDLKMTAGICKAFYTENVDTIIICSSDSDFWGVISSLPEANFLVMYEYEKCGQEIKDALDKRGIFHCAMDDFFTGNAADLQKVVLLHELRERAHTILGKTAMEVTKDVYYATRITAKESEMEQFANKYVKTMRLKTDPNGKFYIAVSEG